MDELEFGIAYIDFFPGSRSFTTLKVDLLTKEGQIVCEQVLEDVNRFWIGEPVEYLALYVRDW